MDLNNSAFVFTWTKNKNYSTYTSKELAFKIKPEKNEFGHKGLEVFIADDKQHREWRCLRFFTQENINYVMRWVERIAERIAAQKQQNEP